MSKRERKPRAQSKSDPEPQQVALTLASKVAFRPQVIRAAHTKHGSRRGWGRREFVVAELAAIFFPNAPPENIKGHDRALVKNVNDRLEKNLDYQAKYPKAKVNHKTVARALEKLRAG
jgi:hypothetical protein